MERTLLGRQRRTSYFVHVWRQRAPCQL